MPFSDIKPMATPIISFCTTCMGRRHHLEKTLPENLKAAISSQVDVEFVIVNYNSKDGLDEWMKEHHHGAVASGLISYYHLDYPKYFRMSHAKNCAHRLARGRIFCNLDSDNFIDENFIHSIVRIITHDLVIVRSIDKVNDVPDLCGRIALSKALFMKLGGYDETMQARNWEDHDFIERARTLLGVPIIEDFNSLSAVAHTDDERLMNYEQILRGLHQRNYNYNIMAINLMNKTVNPNDHNGIQWGRCRARRNWENQFIDSLSSDTINSVSL